MKFYIKRLFPKEFLRFINIVFLKNLFFLISISYFIYFFVLNIQEIISTVNIGCINQIAKGTNIPILHTIELIDLYTGGPKPDVLKRL